MSNLDCFRLLNVGVEMALKCSDRAISRYGAPRLVDFNETDASAAALSREQLLRISSALWRRLRSASYLLKASSFFRDLVSLSFSPVRSSTDTLQTQLRGAQCSWDARAALGGGGFGLLELRFPPV